MGEVYVCTYIHTHIYVKCICIIVRCQLLICIMVSGVCVYTYIFNPRDLTRQCTLQSQIVIVAKTSGLQEGRRL